MFIVSFSDLICRSFSWRFIDKVGKVFIPAVDIITVLSLMGGVLACFVGHEPTAVVDGGPDFSCNAPLPP